MDTSKAQLMVSLARDELDALLDCAAEKGARRALLDLGLTGEDAFSDIRELRALLQALRHAKQTAWHTLIRLGTTGLILTLMGGLAVKFQLL
ncbi:MULTISPECIES: DUF6127 family protein [unclassified Hahella]|uniref:DUF6127 family protein n=1 Tax=unclassified Hahella TaxID=2624107 RepID=UPI000FDDD2A7|nr:MULTISPECIES: DUF6127 family protein [unclassified Hahella]AZZ94003.1 hypothetical protein ENC22_23490 [Hahella sp. KA22]MBU6953827.1 hypothetical protein [Hahella sp. HN01]MDG9671428.1 DUF6127 family protein [Hahella sp. CR1]QAY57377.1 hypothetical protein EUZ85_26075 [Hahella sp. KA22]